MERDQTTNIVDVYVNYLRRKLADAPPGRVIRTVRGQGYMVPGDGSSTLSLVSSVSSPRIVSLQNDAVSEMH
jgi:DNA-binding winged helix-turn-helix (wHTH) protein